MMRNLREGSKIAIISPASIVKEEYIAGAVEHLRSRGYEGIVMPYAKGPADGCYASSLEHRLSDFMAAWTDSGIDAVLCARGGYGAAHLLPYLPPEQIRANAKWLIGFSDISALHAYMIGVGVKSLHGPMAKHLCEQGHNAASEAMFYILSGGKMHYRIDVAKEGLTVRPGRACGRLIGGNLAVLNGLAATPFDIFSKALSEDTVIFIEDISEAIYAVERMLWRLNMAGILTKVKGLIIGRFTDYRPSKKFQSMDAMIASLLHQVGIGNIPVVYNFPVGHVDYNLPMVEGVCVELQAGSDIVELREIDNVI